MSPDYYNTNELCEAAGIKRRMLYRLLATMPALKKTRLDEGLGVMWPVNNSIVQAFIAKCQHRPRKNVKPSIPPRKPAAP